MGALDGRVAIITGAGRGLGREHARLFAAEGAKVVVNDLGDVAEEAADEIRAAGGDAGRVERTTSPSWDGGEAWSTRRSRPSGGLDVLVNNAGILRDRMLVSMTEEEWDAVIDVHLKGHFVPTRFAAAHWREQVKAGEDVQASIIHTSSTSGLLGNPGQTNYGAAKAGIGSFSIICAQELARYGVRSNCIAPAARTRLTEATPGTRRRRRRPDRRLRPVGPGQRLSARRLPRHRRLRVHRPHVLRAGRHGAADGAVAAGQRGVERDARWTIAELEGAASRHPRVTFHPGGTPHVLCTISAEVVPGLLGRRAGRGVPQPPR